MTLPSLDVSMLSVCSETSQRQELRIADCEFANPAVNNNPQFAIRCVLAVDVTIETHRGRHV
jgi:hypothetical protein